MKKIVFIPSLHIICIAFFLCFAAGYYALAWSQPQNTPPNCVSGQPGCDAPIHVGSANQVKTGGLTLNSATTTGGMFYLNVSGSEGDIYNADQIKGYNDLRLCRSASACSTETSNADIWITNTGNVIMLNGYIGVATSTPSHLLSVYGNMGLKNSAYINFGYTDGTNGYGFRDNAGILQYKNSSGSWANLGSGSGSVTSISAGLGLTATADPITTSGTLNVGAGTGISVAADTVSVNYGSAAGTSAEGNKTVVITAGSGITGGGTIAIGAGGTVTINAVDTSATNEIQNIISNKGLQRDASNNFGIMNCATNQIMKYNSSGQWVCASDATGSGIGGSGTTNYVPKFTAATTLGNSLIYDNGTNVGIGTASPAAKLDIQDAGRVYFDVTDAAHAAGNKATMVSFGSPTDSSGVSTNFLWYTSQNTNWLPKRAISLWGYPSDNLGGCCHSLATFGINDSGNNWISLGGATTIGAGGGTALQINDGGDLVITAGGGTSYANTAIYNDTGSLYISTPVGIGTASPGAKLEVKAGAAKIDVTDSSGNEILDWPTAALNIRRKDDYVAMRMISLGHVNDSIYQTNGAAVWQFTLTDNVGSKLTSDSNTNLLVEGPGTFLVTPSVSMGSNLTVGGTLYMDGNAAIDDGGGWHRTYGNTGWYNGTHGGGWFMQDSSWIRSYNDKNVWTGNGLLGSQGGLTVGYNGATPPAGGAIIAGSVAIGYGAPYGSYKLTVVGDAYVDGDWLRSRGGITAGGNIFGNTIYAKRDYMAVTVDCNGECTDFYPAEFCNLRGYSYYEMTCEKTNTYFLAGGGCGGDNVCYKSEVDGNGAATCLDVDGRFDIHIICHK